MPDLSDNGFYLILGILAFWIPALGYWGWMRLRAGQMREETQLLEEELRQSSSSPIRK